jgi:FkbM family methyltransferase
MSDKFFIEIGVSNFGTFEPLLSKGWKGIMVEPVDETFEAIKSHPNLIKEKCAIDTKNGFADFLVADNPKQWANYEDVIGMSGLADAPGPLHEPVYKDRRQTIQVQTMTLDTLLYKHRVTQVDYLKIDAEGKDVEILMNYSFRIMPTNIKFEHVHYSGKVYDASVAGFDQEQFTINYYKLLNRLEKMGYVVWEEQNDVYCFR